MWFLGSSQTSPHLLSLLFSHFIMVSLRLTRVGKKKRPVYRLIAVPKHNDPWGKSLEILGNIDPRTKVRTLNSERIAYWLSVGAQPSSTVHNILVDEGLIKDKKVAVTRLTTKRRGKIEDAVKAEAEKKAAEAEAAKAKAEAEKAEAEAAAKAAEEAAATPEPEVTPEPAEAPADAPTESAEEAPAETPEA